jgi:hypothetical protein
VERAEQDISLFADGSMRESREYVDASAREDCVYGTRTDSTSRRRILLNTPLLPEVNSNNIRDRRNNGSTYASS